MEKFRTGLWNKIGVLIQKLEIEEESNGFIKTKGERMMEIEGENHKFHNSHQEAKDHLILKIESKITKLKGGLIRANTALEHLKTLKP